MKEIFKKIPNFDDYEVSNLGRIVSLKYDKRKVLKHGVNPQGYCIVVLYKGKKSHPKTIHRLVMSVFEGESDLHVNHKDENKLNNNLDNLEYTTNRENSQHYHKTKKSSSKFVGVTWNKKSAKWHSQIQINGKSKHLGYFDDEQKASEAYQNALKELNLKMYKAK